MARTTESQPPYPRPGFVPSASGGGDSFDWFYLAMAHQQLGDAKQARTWYDQACAWMAKNAPDNEELARFRAEAATVLGDNEPPCAEGDEDEGPAKRISPLRHVNGNHASHSRAPSLPLSKHFVQ